MSSPRWNSFTKIMVISGLVLLAITLLYTFRALIAPTIVAFLLTFILSYPVSWLQQRTGWARTTAVLLVYAVLLMIAALMPVLIIPRLIALSSSLNTVLLDLLDQLRQSTTGPLFTFGGFRLSLNNLIQETGTIVRGLLTAVTASPGSLVRSFTTGIVSIVYTLVLNFWLLKDLNKLQRFIIDQVPPSYQEETRRLGSELGEIWQAFLRGQLTLGLVIGIITYICLLIVGMPNAGGLALLAAVMELLPSIGPAISGTVGTLAALLQGSSWLPFGPLPFAVIVGILYAIIGQIESVYFIPRFVGGRVKLHPAVTFAGIINGALAFGVLGILLAAPVIASTRTLLVYLYRKLNDVEPFEPPRLAHTAIRIPGLIAGRKIEGVIFDLEGVLAQPNEAALDWATAQMTWSNPLLKPRYRRWAARRLLVSIEGLINFTVNQMRRFKLMKDLDRLMPIFDLLRAYPDPQDYRPQAGAVEMLHALAGRYELGLITARTPADVLPFLEAVGIADGVFKRIITPEDTINTLPRNDPLALMINSLALQADQVLMVSDTDVNLRAARAMEMATAGILCGMGERGSFVDADLVLTTPLELLDWL